VIPVAGEVCWHPKETTHYLGGSRYIVARPAWGRRWLVEESDGFAGSCQLALCDTRAEADHVAAAYAATRLLHVDGVAS
jgi:hypothetical protein